MNEFEKKIMVRNKNEANVNHDQFLEKLHLRIDITKTKREILFTSFVMIFIIFFLTVTQFGVPDYGFDNYFAESTENLLETDFWNIKSDSLKYDQEFFNNLTYFLFDEGYVWETLELIEQFKLNKEES